MKKAVSSVLLITLLAATPLGALSRMEEKGLAGSWNGTLEASGQKLRLRLNVKADEAGKMTATMDSLDQAAADLPVDTISLEEQTVKFTMAMVQASFEGTLSEGGGEITGTWTQRGQSLPLKWTRAE